MLNLTITALAEKGKTMELLDVKAFSKEMKKRYCTNCDSYNGVRCRACWVDDMISDVEDFPKVDAELVVRCKDCMFYDNRENIGWCILHSHYTSELKDDWTCFNEDDYCSQGKGKAEVKDDL